MAASAISEGLAMSWDKAVTDNGWMDGWKFPASHKSLRCCSSSPPAEGAVTYRVDTVAETETVRGGWRELEEEEVKDHEEGEETRASTFTPHHTELECLLRYAWRSHTHTHTHTHTIREDQRDSPPPPPPPPLPPVSCSWLSLHRRLQSNIDWTPLNSQRLRRNTSSNTSWSVRWNSVTPPDVFLQSGGSTSWCKTLCNTFSWHCCRQKAHLGIRALMLTKANSIFSVSQIGPQNGF